MSAKAAEAAAANSTVPPPTFRQFVQYLLATEPSRYDTHWRPFWLHCAPCKVSYDAVVKVETMEEDVTELRKMVPLLRQLKLGRLQVGLEVPRVQENLVVRAHLMQLTKQERADLYKIYRPDFVLFDYKKSSIEEF